MYPAYTAAWEPCSYNKLLVVYIQLLAKSSYTRFSSNKNCLRPLMILRLSSDHNAGAYKILQ